MNTYESVNIVYGQAFANTLLAAMKTAPTNPLINAGKLRLSHDPAFNPTSSSTISALAAQECDFSGYTAGGVTFTLTTGIDLSAAAQGATTYALFEAATATPFVSDTAYGYWIDDGTNVIAAERFANGGSAAFNAVGAFLGLTVFLPVQMTQATS